MRSIITPLAGRKTLNQQEATGNDDNVITIQGHN
jgi:hypothetical protein